MSSCSAVPRSAFAVAASSAPCAGTSRQITCAPSRASTSAIAAPIPREAPVTSATLPASGASQSGVAAATASPMLDDLPGHVGRAAREQEAQRRLDVALGARRDAHELRRRAGAQLLRGGAHEALERALGDGGAGVGGRAGRGAEHEQPAAGRDLADVRVEEVVGGAQVLGGRDPGGVEHDGAERVGLVGAVARVHAGVLGGAARVLRRPPSLRADAP